MLFLDLHRPFQYVTELLLAPSEVRMGFPAFTSSNMSKNWAGLRGHCLEEEPSDWLLRHVTILGPSTAATCQSGSRKGKGSRGFAQQGEDCRREREYYLRHWRESWSNATAHLGQSGTFGSRRRAMQFKICRKRVGKDWGLDHLIKVSAKEELMDRKCNPDSDVAGNKMQ